MQAEAAAGEELHQPGVKLQGSRVQAAAAEEYQLRVLLPEPGVLVEAGEQSLSGEVGSQEQE